jgi:hypothetical protein
MINVVVLPWIKSTSGVTNNMQVKGGVTCENKGGTKYIMNVFYVLSLTLKLSFLLAQLVIRDTT